MIDKNRKDYKLVEAYCSHLSIEDPEGDYICELMPPYGDVSYRILRNGEFFCYVTTRVRDTRKGQFTQERLPLSKHTFAYWAWNELGIKTVYLIEWADGNGYLELWNKPDVIDTVVENHDSSLQRDIYILYDVKWFVNF